MSLGICLLSACLATAQTGNDNLDFRQPSLVGWEGAGFRVAPPVASSGSVDEAEGQTGLIHRVLTIPQGVLMVRCRAAAIRPSGLKPQGDLDIVILGAGKKPIPKLVRQEGSWVAASRLHAQEAVNWKEYAWSVAGRQGETVRLVLVDEDRRPGCFVSATGFELAAADPRDDGELDQFMVKLAEKHHLPPMQRFASAHFVALSNAEDKFSELRVRDCELMYACFYDHFAKLGLKLSPPPGKLAVAIFDSQTGFEAYLGRKMSPLITGIYHPQSNRFVMYDYGQNAAYVARKQDAEQRGKRIATHIDRQTYQDKVQRQASDFRRDANIGTIMHEVSHQLAFNSGMLNRQGDAPLFLVEGLACYCEATDNAAWQGIGRPNPERLNALARGAAGGGKLIPLAELIESDNWMRGKTTANTILLGYAQSWALVRMLLEKRPQAMAAYLERVYARRTPDHRLTDFRQSFGANLSETERQLTDYINQMLKR